MLFNVCKFHNSTGEFFGLMQAESRKIGYKFDFTNNLISEHKLFIEVAEQLGISRSRWSFGVIYNPNLGETEVFAAKELFAQNLNLAKQNGYITKSRTINDVAYSIYISSTLLNLVMNTLLKIFMKELPVYVQQKGNIKEFCKGFVLKDLLGDGTIVFPSVHGVQIVISEEDKEAQNAIACMFRIFGIAAYKNLNKIYLSTNFDSVLWFLQNDAFLGHIKNQKKLESYVKRNFYFTMLEKRIKHIKSKVDAKTFANLAGLKLPNAKRYLETAYRRGFLQKMKYNGNNFYNLTDKGNKFLYTMASL